MVKAGVCLFCLFLTMGFAQAQHGRYPGWEAKIGAGVAFHGTGDILTSNIEAELGKKINRILSGSAAIHAGYDLEGSSRSWRQHTSFAHLDINAFASPFGNKGIYNFKVGTGPSLLYVRDLLNSGTFTPAVQENRLTVGFSVIIEQEVRIRQHYLLGLKFMTQPYLNGDIVHTLSLKAGVLLY